jgi:hypothetical protein
MKRGRVSVPRPVPNLPPRRSDSVARVNDVELLDHPAGGTGPLHQLLFRRLEWCDAIDGTKFKLD